MSLQAQLETIRQTFVSQLGDKLARLGGSLAHWSTALDSRSLRDAVAEAHKLAGSGATFGFPAISTTAQELENRLSQVLTTGRAPNDADKAAIRGSFDALNGIAQSVRESRAGTVATGQTAAGPLPAVDTGRERSVLLIEDDAHLADHLTVQLGYFGYRSLVLRSPQQLESPDCGDLPAAILMDIVFPEGALAGPAALIAQRGTLFPDVPVVFISSRGDFEARLAAVRAGGRAYLQKPIDISALVNILDAVTSAQSPNPFRVLIVDDEPTLATYYESALRAAGLEAHVVTDPSRIGDYLVEYAPDLILTDLYMPACNGIELAAVIRQQDAFVSIPIVFLSSESNQDKQLLALRLGGDDFLTKPIDPAQLVSVVISRAQRSRLLRSYIEYDGLTGLLNHTRLKERLEIEVLRSARFNRPLVFAMIDLDHFKLVNDSYGHTTGDRVLASLSKLLSQRLRRTDIAGRYGGEEFGVILTETDAGAARKVLNAIRHDFAAIRQIADRVEFSVTFSCGIAEFPGSPSAEELIAAADTALYRAKQAGRNRLADQIEG